MIIVECGCARHKRGFRSIFVNGKFDRTEKGEPPPPSLRDKLRGVLEKAAPVQCAGLDLNAIRCAWCGEGTYLCSCGIMTCTGVREGLIYTCMCGLRGTLKEMPDDAVVRGDGVSEQGIGRAEQAFNREVLMNWMIVTAAAKAAKAAISVFVYVSILFAGFGALLGALAFSAWFAGSLESYKDALVPVGVFMIVVPVISAVGWMVQIIVSTTKGVIDFKDWLERRREIKAHVKAMMEYNS